MKGKKAATFSVTTGTKKVLEEVAEKCGFIGLSEAVRDTIRRYCEDAAQKRGA